MDPVSQGLVGSVACQIISNKKKLLVITVISFLSALAPDLDIFIRSHHLLFPSLIAKDCQR